MNSQKKATDLVKKDLKKKTSSNSIQKFFKVSNNNINIFKEAVNSYIVNNKGIRDFYDKSDIEQEWLNNILLTEKDWHNQLQKLESDYRNAFQDKVSLISGQNDIEGRINNYSKNIKKLEKDIDEIRRQIVQINVDQQVYINSLRNTPITSLLAIETLYTPDIMKYKDNIDILNNSLSKFLEDPVMAYISKNYNKINKTPFKTGSAKISYVYPENITIFDSNANELVYLFLKIEANPFSNNQYTNIDEAEKNIDLKIFSNIEEIENYLQIKKVGDKRLKDWLKKEFKYNIIANKNILNTIQAKLDEFDLFRNGLNKNISELDSKITEIRSKKNLLVKKGTIESIENEYKKSKSFYENFFAKRQALTHEKYILENDVMFSLFHVEGQTIKNNGSKNKKQNINSKKTTNITIAGRQLKDIFADILITAHKNKAINLQNYTERIYMPNKENSQLIQGELGWKIESEEFSILKLTKGNVGSRSHFVVHLAKITNLISIPAFPAEKRGICKASLLFKRGKNVMRDSQKPILNRLVKCLRKYPQQMIQITGHTDPLKPNYGEGSKYSNVILGLKRAEEIVKKLTKLKFNSGRFIVVSRGAQTPVAIGKSNKELQKNRRVEIISKPNF